MGSSQKMPEVLTLPLLSFQSKLFVTDVSNSRFMLQIYKASTFILSIARLIAKAKLGSHPRSRVVHFFNVWGSSKESEVRSSDVLMISREVFFAHFGASFASSSATATPQAGTPASATDYAHYAPTFAAKICLKIIKNPGSHNFF